MKRLRFSSLDFIQLVLFLECVMKFPSSKRKKASADSKKNYTLKHREDCQ